LEDHALGPVPPGDGGGGEHFGERIVAFGSPDLLERSAPQAKIEEGAYAGSGDTQALGLSGIQNVVAKNDTVRGAGSFGRDERLSHCWIWGSDSLSVQGGPGAIVIGRKEAQTR
jgi:hypothetical protein